MTDIAEYMWNATKSNFAEERAPDGSVWARKSPVTIAQYRREGIGAGMILRKDGALNTSVARNAGPDFAEVFVADLPYARMMQFGGKRSQFPNLWGDIPARPFLGFEQEQKDAVSAIISEWVEGLFDA